MIKKINCKHYNDYGHCNIKKKRLFGFLWKVKMRCVEYYKLGYFCNLAERYPKPIAPPPPPRKREYNERIEETLISGRNINRQ